MFCPINQQNLLDCLVFFTKQNQIQFQRGLYFTSLIVIVYSVQFLYICFHVIIMQKPLLETGSPIFIAYSIYNFAMVVFSFLGAMVYAAQVNDSYNKMLSLLQKLTRDVYHTQLMAKYGRVWLLNEEDSLKR